MNSDPFRQVLKIADVLADLDRPWYVAGGWAIDLYVQKQRRNHKDVDIAIFRRDQITVQQYLMDRAWTLSRFIGDSGALEGMAASQHLELPDRGIHAEPPGELPAIDLLLSETNDDQWWYHADPKITHPLRTVGLSSKRGVPILAPEIVLLFKARHLYQQDDDSLRHRQADEGDFQDVQEALTGEQRSWLAWAIGRLYPQHPWLDQLKGGNS